MPAQLQEPLHKLTAKPVTCSLYQVLYFEPTCSPKHALPQHMLRGTRRQSVTIGVSKSKKRNVGPGQGQPKHVNI